MAERELSTPCCVVGGGPAGIMLGYLIARAHVPVVVLEKHRGFFRDFRGDTKHPSTLGLLHENLLEDFLKLPHQEVQWAEVQVGDTLFRAADFRHVPGRCKFFAFLPQWDFLNFLSGAHGNFPISICGRSTKRSTGLGKTAASPASSRTLQAVLCAFAPHWWWAATAGTEIPGMDPLLGYAVSIGVRPEHVRHPERRGASLAAAAGAAIGRTLGSLVLFATSLNRLAAAGSCSAGRPTPRSTRCS